MWPWIRWKHDRWLNRILLTRQLEPIVRRSPEPVIAITTIPIVADLIGRLPVDRWVYYCVDDFGKWPGLDQAAIQQAEDRLVLGVDIAVAASEHLQAGLACKGRTSHLLTHGVDLEVWKHPTESSPLSATQELERPLIVFWGLVDRRLDVEFIRRLSADLTRGTILLVGPEADPDPRLTRLDRVVRLPAMDYEKLPRLAREASVLIMPYADLPVTRAMQPLKLKEYLATGKATVVRDLPANRAWADALDLVETPEAFSAAVRQRLAEGIPESQRSARGRLEEESWAAKAEQLKELALELSSRDARETAHAI